MLKKKIIALSGAAAILFSMMNGITVNAATVNIDTNSFPDISFRSWVSQYADTDHNGMLSQVEADAVVNIDLTNRSIRDLTGIGVFRRVTELNIFGCNLRSIDLSSSLPLLQRFTCQLNSELTTLDVSNHPDLEYVDCSYCNLTAFSASRCPELEVLNCSNNSLKSIWIPNSVNLTDVNISNNVFTSINWGNNRTQLRVFNCDGNNLTSVGISGLIALEQFSCENNDLTSIDVSNNLNLAELRCGNNPLTELNVRNSSNLGVLFCSNASLSALDLSDCSGLYNLDCPGNRLTELDLSRNTGLCFLDCSNNRLTDLDLSNNTNLITLECYGNQLTELDITGSRSLAALNILHNDIGQVDISNCPYLLSAYTDRGIELVSDEGGDYYRAGNGFLYDTDTVIITGLEENGGGSSSQSGNSGNGSSSQSGNGGNGSSSQSGNGSSGSPSQSGNGGSGSSSQSGNGSSGSPSQSGDGSSGSSSQSGNGSSGSGNGSSSQTADLPPYDPSGSSSETGVAGFVERLYTIALDRASDPAGKADWVAAVTERGQSGADVARGFLYSSEFLNRGYSDRDFVTVLYRTFFNREPDADGLNSWVNALSNGASKQDVIEGFINSVEWANLCVFYGIRSGGTAVPTTNVEPNAQTIDFCTRLYTTCLNRNADQSGLMAWARQLANQRDTGSGAARGFFFSSEFIGQNVSNGEYVTRLYRTFMGREPDESGFNAWVAQLDSGVSRDVVFEGFAQSPEFTRICAGYGIIR